MEDSSKTIIIKPALLKAGIPLAITAAGFAISKILSRNSTEEELGFAKSRMEAEMELESALAIERARAGFLEREISSLETGKRRFEGLVGEYERVVQRLEVAGLGNELLEEKVRRMMRKIRGQERLIVEKGERVGELEAEVLNCLEELERRNEMIDGLEEQVETLKADLVVVKLSSDSEEKAAAEKQNNEEMVAVEDYKRIAKEQDEARTNQAAETTELTYLRWTNACLRHELMRSYQLQQQLRSDLDDEPHHHHHDKEEDCLEVQQHHESSLSPDHQHHHQHSRRKKLIHKLKKWVEGNDHENNSHFHSKNNQQGNNKCIGWMPVHDEGDEDVAARRRSCSSF